ncbi:unnamed protein product [Durusdinium trenchii]|uniref:Uncharacterized protein n=1 Tax=Durusdinium trenchii TaxID=1381693 RepID=A0ABP0IZK6_9DINO
MSPPPEDGVFLYMVPRGVCEAYLEGGRGRETRIYFLSLVPGLTSADLRDGFGDIQLSNVSGGWMMVGVEDSLLWKMVVGFSKILQDRISGKTNFHCVNALQKLKEL